MSPAVHALAWLHLLCRRHLGTRSHVYYVSWPPMHATRVFTGCECTYPNFFTPKVDIMAKKQAHVTKSTASCSCYLPLPLTTSALFCVSKYPVFPALLHLSFMSQGFHRAWRVEKGSRSRDLQASGCYSLCLNSSWSPLLNPSHKRGRGHKSCRLLRQLGLAFSRAYHTHLAGPHPVVLSPWLHIRIPCNLKK